MLPPRVHQRVVERVELVHLAHRIGERGDVTTLPAGASPPSARFRRRLRERPGRPFFARAQAAVPESMSD